MLTYTFLKKPLPNSNMKKNLQNFQKTKCVIQETRKCANSL